MSPADEGFTEADLAPDPTEQRARWRERADRLLTAVAVGAASVAAGGLLTLHACVSPVVGPRTLGPHAEAALVGARGNLDAVTITCGLLYLGCEVGRTIVALGRRRSPWARLRRLTAIFAAALAVYVGVVLTPSIGQLHQAGPAAVAGPVAERLEQLTTRTRWLDNMQMALAALLVLLHVFTLRSARDAQLDEDEQAAAPLPPGPPATGGEG